MALDGLYQIVDLEFRTHLHRQVHAITPGLQLDQLRPLLGDHLSDMSVSRASTRSAIICGDT